MVPKSFPSPRIAVASGGFEFELSAGLGDFGELQERHQ